jgi:hypothetical protein
MRAKGKFARSRIAAPSQTNETPGMNCAVTVTVEGSVRVLLKKAAEVVWTTLGV